MLPRLIVAGTSGGVVSRRRGYKPFLDGWDIFLCPSKTPKADLWSCWDEVVQIADEPGHGGAHILAFHNVYGERDSFDSQIYGRHRLIWLDQALLGEYGATDFTNRLKALAEFEQEWRDSIRPTDPKSPLILPESCFDARRGFQEVWRRAHRLRRDRGHIPDLATLLHQFRDGHFHKGFWIDDHGRVFDPRAAKHAFHVPMGRRWKFAYEVPLGFHFDVRMRDGGKLRVCDNLGVRYEFNEYTNIDCHGFMRGGG